MWLVIFDCDGVLVDSERLAAQVMSRQLEAQGLVWDPATCEARLSGLPLDRCCLVIEEALGHPLPDDFLAELQAQTFACFQQQLQPIEGVIDLLERLQNECCVASSGMPDKLQLSLSLTGLIDYFPARIFSRAEVANGKPAPDLFLLAAARLGYPVARCVVIEDSVPGVLAARAAGMSVIGYHRAPAQREQLLRTGAHWVAADMGQVLSRLAALGVTIAPPERSNEGRQSDR